MDLPNPGIEPRYPILQVDSLPFEPPGKPKNIRVGSLSLLQGIFLTQESTGVSSMTTYGGTFAFLNNYLKKFNVDVTFVNMQDLDAVKTQVSRSAGGFFTI